MPKRYDLMSRSIRCLHLLALFAATAAFGFSQSAPPAPPSASPAPTRTAPASNPQAQLQTLKASAQLVIVDVIVTDSKQTPIHNLKASDFTVLENGAPQQVTS